MADTPPLPCQRCGSPTVEIGLLDGGAQLTMRSCSRCDHRSWLRAGRPAQLGDVLESVASTGRRSA